MIEDRIPAIERAEFQSFKRDHTEDFLEAFNLFDKNKDGRICIDELGTVMQACGQNPTADDVRKAMVELDKNMDGKVEFEEFVYHMFKIYKNPLTMSRSLEAAFKLFDKDGNGLIDAKEFREIVQKLGGDPLLDSEIAEMMDMADTNKDGKIDYQEFCGILANQ
ncbi:calmodulin-like protein 3 isoform X2 [Argopecten irradians]|uniref:calmodulin-like protein 3 isoform X2 n=1 Tax=Argopecten irradians TaxID=31199 RepID=UPI003716166D